MINSILISGTYEFNNGKILYKINIYATENNGIIQFIRAKEIAVHSYQYLWDEVKKLVCAYFNTDSYLDGAYTVYQEHLIGLHA